MTSSEKSSFIKKIWLQSSFSSFSNESTTSYQHHKVSSRGLALPISLTPQYYTFGTLIPLLWGINSSLLVKSENCKHWQLRLLQQSQNKPEMHFSSYPFILSSIRKGSYRWTQVKYPLSECTFHLTYSHTAWIQSLASLHIHSFFLSDSWEAQGI